MACFVDLIQTILVTGFVVLLGTSLGMFKELFWVKIWCTIATHMGFKTASLGTKLRSPAPLLASNFKRSYLSRLNFDSNVL